MMLIDPPSPSAPESEWREFLGEMEALASEPCPDAALVRSYIRLAKQELAIPPDEPRFTCPNCKQKTGVNISYGYPTAEFVKRAERNEIVLGGCNQAPGDPDRECLNCGHQWEIVRRGGRRRD